MPSADPQTETMAITQGHLPHNGESPPAVPNRYCLWMTQLPGPASAELPFLSVYGISQRPRVRCRRSGRCAI
jgi:hypothetical protein